MRGDDGVVRAFYNSCRHRGAPVVRGDCGSARLLSCQFHGWTYDLRGDLVRVPDERDFVGLCREERALPAGALRAVGRLVLRQPRPRREAAARVARTVAGDPR